MSAGAAAAPVVFEVEDAARTLVAISTDTGSMSVTVESVEVGEVAHA